MKNGRNSTKNHNTHNNCTVFFHFCLKIVPELNSQVEKLIFEPDVLMKRRNFYLQRFVGEEGCFGRLTTVEM